MKIRVGPVVISLLLTIGMSAQGQDIAALTATCDDCHGANGISDWPDMPTIAGIDSFVHSEALYTYRDGARPCAESAYRRGDTSRAPASMCTITANLADEDIEEVAAHYADLSFIAAKQDFDPALAAAGQAVHERECEICHTDGGSNPDDESSILAGQWTGYLEATLQHFRSGERDQPERMQRAIEGLGDDDITALLHYYASQQ